MQQSVNALDQQLAEISGVVDILIFVEEEADEDRRRGLRTAIIGTLYILTDMLGRADEHVAALRREVAADTAVRL